MLESKLNKEEQELLESPKGAYAVIMGYLARLDGKVTQAKFNKLLIELNYDRMKGVDYRETLKAVTSSPKLLNLYRKASSGETSIEEVTSYKGTKTIAEIEVPSIVTASSIDKVATQGLTANFRKAQRKGSAQEYLSQLVAKNMCEAAQNLTPMKAPHINLHTDKSRTLVVTPADWHVGAVVDNIQGNCYNFDIFQSRLDEYFNEIANCVKEMKINKIVCVHLGDFIEGIDMRKINQAFDAEFDATTQLAKAQRAYLEFIQGLALLTDKLSVGLIGGNHDRFTSDKKDAIYGDNLAYNVADQLLLLKQLGVFGENVTVIDNRSDIYTIEQKVEGKVVLFKHGDAEKRTAQTHIPKFIKDHPIDYMFFGHYHSNAYIQEDFERFSFMTGSIMGNNSYSAQLGLPTTRASQLMTIFEEGKKAVTTIPVFFSE